MQSINNIASYFEEKIKDAILNIDDAIASKISEIRIRKNMPIIIVIKNKSYFIDYNADIYDYEYHSCIKINETEFEELFLKLCNYSIYSYTDSLKNGFLTLPNGSRVGVASTAIISNSTVTSIKDVTSLNIRIPRIVSGCSNDALNCLYINSFPSIIIAGKPNSGKTTFLRDIAYQLSNGFNDEYRKITIVDERNELALIGEIGCNTDVLSCFSKAKGVEIATRTLSPEMIVCDEIATIEEVNSIKYAFSSGIAFALSVHITDYNNLYNKPIIRELLATNEFAYIVLLEEYTYKSKIIDCNEVVSEIYRNDNNNDVFNRLGNISFYKP